jgi:hypothetical protein
MHAHVVQKCRAKLWGNVLNRSRLDANSYADLSPEEGIEQSCAITNRTEKLMVSNNGFTRILVCVMHHLIMDGV